MADDTQKVSGFGALSQVALAPLAATNEEPEQVVEPKVVVETPAVVTSLTADEGDSTNVAELKIQLAGFVESLKKPGKKPEDFAERARIFSRVTDMVIRNPTPPVLNLLLAFYTEQVSELPSFLKGSTTLQSVEERRVGFLHVLFSDLANQNAVRVSSAEVINVLKKPEISNFYDRKVSALQKNRTKN
jgi:hypothetical protein